jgi:hypothetical protein
MHSMSQEQLFDSPAAALAFAFNFSSQQYPVSPMGRLLKGANIGGGKGLGGLDGSAQAAYILAAVERMPPMARACIAARYAPKAEPCTCGKPCCAGEKVSQAYREAMAAILHWSFEKAPAGVDSATRAAILAAYFDRSVSLTREFERRKVPRSTGFDAKKKIWDALKTLETEAQNAVTGELAWLFDRAA